MLIVDLQKTKNWKQPTCPSIVKLWCIHALEYCSAIKIINYQFSDNLDENSAG